MASGRGKRVTETGRMSDWRDFMNTPILGVPLLWYVILIFALCVAGMAWVILSGPPDAKPGGGDGMGW